MRKWIGLLARHVPQAAVLVLLLLLIVALHPIHIVPARGASAIVFTDRSGLLLGTVLTRDGDRTVHVPLSGIAPSFLRAIVATEDRRFFLHHGVDGLAFARAVGQVAATGRIVSGGSTISMQLARLRYDLPRTPLGKVYAIILALRIEAGTSKAAILEDYVNRIPMGGNLVGVEAASRTYFGAPASELDLAQSAFLAAIPNDPVRLDPYTHRAALQARQRAILALLHARRDADETIALMPRSAGIDAAPHLLLRLARALPDDTSRVRTTIDGDLQRFVEAQTADVVEALRSRGVHDAAAIVVDNQTGAILAYAGSPDYFDAGSGGSNDGVTALRQPGSTLKPFLYELGFERRTIRPTTILSDVPTAYALPNNGRYAPADYSDRYAGPVRARIALADSLNVPAVRVLAAIGVAPFLTRLRALGFAHLTRSPDYYGLGLTLGSGEVSLEELAGAYATAANGGRRIALHARAGDTSPSTFIGDASSWSLITDMLADAHARARAFGVNSLLRLPFASAVKTGTSSDFRDTWTAGYTRAVTVATWVGNFDGTPMRRVSGVTGAAPLWNRIMLHLHEKSDPPPFAAPRGYERTAICATTGTRPTGACPAVVTEWLDSGDRAAYNRAPAPLGREYDAWLALAPAQQTSGLRIVAPRDGARYVAAPGSRIAVDARGARPDLTWTFNGRPLARHEAHWLWPLQRGRWTIVARSAGARRAVTIEVSAPPSRRSARGFTFDPGR